MKSLPEHNPLTVDCRVAHRLWPELGLGTIIELIGRKNSRGDPVYARVQWDAWQDDRSATYDVGSIRKE